MKKNAMTVVEFATAYPFRLPELDVMCVLCSRSFEDPKDFRDHFDNDHKVFNIKDTVLHLNESILKVDCTDLCCRLCDQLFDDVDSVANHLSAEHDKKISNDGFLFQIYKFGPDKWVCAYCNEKFMCLRALSRHTASHFRNFVCPTCGKKYTFDTDLTKHIKNKHSNVLPCVKCRQTFQCDKQLKEHMDESKSCWPYKCMYCAERFRSHSIKTTHMENIHGIAARIFKCTVCPLEFVSSKLFRDHYTKEHTDKFVCSICNEKFGSKYILKMHYDRHTGHKEFKCDVCGKDFLRKCQLVQHYWAHREDKRFECKLCDKKFNQKVTWKDDIQDAMRKNTMTVLEYATAYPFRLPERDVMCVLCSRSFEDPKDLRDHFDNHHKRFSIKGTFLHLAAFARKLKVDCTNLHCRICDEVFNDVECIADHLNAEHNKEISPHGFVFEIFKFGPDKWVCAYCKEKFMCLRALSRHTASHFRNFVCPTCGKKYTFDADLTKHIKNKHSNAFSCVKCRKTFPSDKQLKEHLKESKSCWPYKCMYCVERFRSNDPRIAHMQKFHGIAARIFKCTVCPLEFVSSKLFRNHYVKEHTDKFVCSICDQKFASNKCFKVHNDRHAGHKQFKCDVCGKDFLRKCQLVQHYWAHREDKRFECKLCDKKFNQKVTWKGHMKSKHAELVDF
ncbi:hypothetical protein JYU34_017918 [Plutella xylostella]|uniref:C2H2-type domain-containing protein n=1 Tax=Plutella xylostella TaxID=51655 RepID=A0ABQ7PZB3_PLUXY|nr:hypothetical protein JYU34_017918 [Plutella xylostella]